MLGTARGRIRWPRCGTRWASIGRLWLRYLRWIFGVLRGDFGISYTYNVPVAELDRASASLVSVPLALHGDPALHRHRHPRRRVRRRAARAACADAALMGARRSASRCRTSGSACC